MSQQFPNLSEEDQEYLKQLWRAVGPGIGVGETLIQFSHDLQHRRDKMKENGASPQQLAQTEEEIDRIDQISETLYGEPVADIAQQLQREEANPMLALQGDHQGLTQPFTRVEELGQKDADQGWIEPIDENNIENEDVSMAVYSLRQIVNLSDPRPGDTFAQSPMGQMVLHYWQGASRKLVEQALEQVDPGRVKTHQKLIRRTAATMDELELEEYVNNLREEAAEVTADWLEASRRGETLSKGERVNMLTSIHQFHLADQLAAQRANQAVEQAYMQAISRGEDPQQVFMRFIRETADEMDHDPEVVREIADGVMPADADASLTLRRFRSARRELQRRQDTPQPTPTHETNPKQRPSSSGRGL